ncbi:Mismatch repair endonuclease pms2 [Blyttiomyces sp. JEL0837]|nr:Mismatch repair endonuclease pms2 [Blyttiomyces sp. JEL0837]
MEGIIAPTNFTNLISLQDADSETVSYLHDRIIKVLHGQSDGRWRVTCKYLKQPITERLEQNLSELSESQKLSQSRTLYLLSNSRFPQAVFSLASDGAEEVFVKGDSELEPIIGKLKKVWNVRQTVVLEGSSYKCNKIRVRMGVIMVGLISRGALIEIETECVTDDERARSCSQFLSQLLTGVPNLDKYDIELGGENKGTTNFKRKFSRLDTETNDTRMMEIAYTLLKELVENSLDAGSTMVEVRLKEYGLEGFEVIGTVLISSVEKGMFVFNSQSSSTFSVVDNGCGISEENYETLALKHYTSKIASFEDLDSVVSFGFRGEALSSLCAVSTLTVTTCCNESIPVGIKLEYDSHGKLKSKSTLARQKGTTVTIRNLFQSLPVRFREFKKNIKREYAKCLDLIHAYALITDRVRISCSNQTGKGDRVIQVSTSGNDNVKANFANLYGAKSLNQIVEFNLEVAMSEEEDAENGERVKVAGLISKAEPLSGRSSADRQFYFINKRPCDLPKDKLEGFFGPNRSYLPANTAKLGGENLIRSREVPETVEEDDEPLLKKKRKVGNMEEEKAVIGSTMSEPESIASPPLFDPILEDDIQDSLTSKTLSPTSLSQSTKVSPATSKSSRRKESPFKLIDSPSHIARTKALSFAKWDATKWKQMDAKLIEDINDVMEVECSIGRIKSAITRRACQKRVEENRTKSRNFQAGIGLDESSNAVEELNKLISKEDFTRMKILGQFNKGFIIARLDDDLFIIDQHASDEKYNFETFGKALKLTSQKLISPIPLQLPPQSELIALDHEEILKNNGFRIALDESALPGQRIKLVNIPQSRSITFGVADLEDLLHKIGEGASKDVRCSRVVSMLASRACRSSVMIGDDLGQGQMEKNCPHGRPTMRHLYDLGALTEKEN